VHTHNGKIRQRGDGLGPGCGTRGTKGVGARIQKVNKESGRGGNVRVREKKKKKGPKRGWLTLGSKQANRLHQNTKCLWTGKETQIKLRTTWQKNEGKLRNIFKRLVVRVEGKRGKKSNFENELRKKWNQKRKPQGRTLN